MNHVVALREQHRKQACQLVLVGYALATLFMLENVLAARGIQAELFRTSVDYVAEINLSFLWDAFFISIVTYFKDNFLRVASGP